MHKLNKIVISLSVLLLIGGCGQRESMKELKAYVERIKARPARPIEPLPEVKPYQSFVYSAEDLRSPFVPPMPEENFDQIVIGNGIHPDIERRKELLEHYPLDTLRMVGTLERNNKTWAIIVDSDGMVHRITKGNYIGQNHGRVMEISEEGLKIEEIVPDGRGGWQEQEASMALIEE